MNKFFTRLFFLLIIGLLFCLHIQGQTTTLKSTVCDSVTGKPIPFVIVLFKGSSSGGLTDDNGEVKISNKSGINVVGFKSMGYRTKWLTIQLGETTKNKVYLAPKQFNLNEVIVHKEKAKYSKKNNPAIELIEKVIAHKYDNLPETQSYYQNEQYEHLIFALDDFDPNAPFAKKLTFLSQYIDTSKIDQKIIVPVSVRETLSSFYYRKKPNATKRIVTAHKTEGLDQSMNLETIDGVVNHVFKDVNIRDNNIELLLHNFVSPLSSGTSPHFYKWYITDTVTIKDKKYINLSFIPFNTSDVGFTGSLTVAADSTYALKHVQIYVPSNANVNFVDHMLVDQDFEQVDGIWVMKKSILAMDLSIEKQLKGYVEKVNYNNEWKFNIPIDPVFINPAPEIYVSDYEDKTQQYWDLNKPKGVKPDYMMTEMMAQLGQKKLLNTALTIANIASSGGYIATSKDKKKNKVDIGKLPSFFSFNPLEGARFRGTLATNTNFNKHLFFYGYLAYGTKDEKFKYNTQLTWSFRDDRYHPFEYPIHKISFMRKFDVNTLGQPFGDAEHDDIFLSGSRTDKEMTYNLLNQLEYQKEYYGGLSLTLTANTQKEIPGGNLKFLKESDNGTIYDVNNLQTTNLGITLRFAPREKFSQQRRHRAEMPTRNNTIFSISHFDGFKNVFGSDYHFQKSSMSLYRESWIPPFGKIYTTLSAEKIWGAAPYPALLTPNVNTSYMSKSTSFYMIKPLEFINDTQISWSVSYHMEGWLLNRIPFIKKLKWREVAEFRGFFGGLSKKNLPENNHDLYLFPANSYSMDSNPYMEASIGISNILKILRVDYVRRFTYLDIPGAEKGKFIVSLSVNF